jgi:hypothetical protein
LRDDAVGTLERTVGALDGSVDLAELVDVLLPGSEVTKDLS